MRNDDPQPQIDRLRALRVPDDIIFNRLLLEGWPEDVLHGAIVPKVLAAAAEVTVAPATQKPRASRVIAFASFSALFAAGAAISVSVSFFSKPPVVYSISLSDSASSTLSMLQYGALPALSDPDYYNTTKNQLIAQKVSFIDANLSSMQLTVYVEGKGALTVAILAKGEVGSWWETPAGIYKIESKEPNRLSSFGDVYMPYSLDFQGNFFIHGWPYYPDGTLVSTSYSGGCIRLSTDDAKKVYELAEADMPVIVYNTSTAEDSFSYQLKGPAITASEYLVADVKNGTVLMSKKSTSTAPIASITKLISALVATEYINLDRKIIVQPEAIVYTLVPRLKASSHIRAYDLLFLLLQESSNEAAEAFAAELGRDQFVNYMNEKARAIGLTHTTFNDPSGAKDDISTTEDLFTLLRYVNDNRQFVFGITTGDLQDSGYGKPAFSGIANFNIIKNAPAELLGGKIGETNQAGETYAGIFSVKIGAKTRDIAVIVLGSRNAEGDVRKLLNYAHGSYAPGEPINPSE